MTTWFQLLLSAWSSMMKYNSCKCSYSPGTHSDFCANHRVKWAQASWVWRKNSTLFIRFPRFWSSWVCQICNVKEIRNIRLGEGLPLSPGGQGIKTVLLMQRALAGPYGELDPTGSRKEKTNKPQEKQMSKDKKEKSKNQNIGALFPSCKVQLLGMSPILLIPQLLYPCLHCPPSLGHFLPLWD